MLLGLGLDICMATVIPGLCYPEMMSFGASIQAPSIICVMHSLEQISSALVFLNYDRSFYGVKIVPTSKSQEKLSSLKSCSS